MAESLIGTAKHKDEADEAARKVEAEKETRTAYVEIDFTKTDDGKRECREMLRDLYRKAKSSSAPEIEIVMKITGLEDKYGKDVPAHWLHAKFTSAEARKYRDEDFFADSDAVRLAIASQFTGQDGSKFGIAALDK